jgi:hypothetical protein
MTTKWDDFHSARRAELIAQGVPPKVAMEQSAMETLRAQQAEIRASTPRGPDGRPLLSDEEAAFDASMADAMGQSNLSAAATPIEMEPELKPVYRRAPGPVEYGTGESKAGADIYAEDEAAAYRYRKPTAAAGLPVAATAEEVEAAMAPGGPYRGGEYLPSQEDSDMYARGMVYNVNPATGVAGYSVAYPDTAAAGALGVPGRLGARQDLRQPVRDVRTGQLLQGTHKYEKDVAESPLGQVEVYRPSPEFREQLAAQEQRRRVERLGRAAGMGDSEILAMASGSEPVDLESLRSAGRLRRESEREDRLARVAQRAMERGNPMSQLDDEWRQYVLASQMLGRPAGASPTDVQSRNLEVATGLAGRWGQGTGGAPGQEAILATRAEAERRAAADPRELAREAVNRGEPRHSDVLNRANAIVDQHFSLVTSLGNTSGFLDLETHGTGEVEEAAQMLSDETGLPLEASLAIMRQIQRERNRNFNLSP